MSPKNSGVLAILAEWAAEIRAMVRRMLNRRVSPIEQRVGDLEARVKVVEKRLYQMGLALIDKRSVTWRISSPTQET